MNVQFLYNILCIATVKMYLLFLQINFLFKVIFMINFFSNCWFIKVDDIFFLPAIDN